MLAFLANAAIYVVPFLLIITVIVTVHEFGHFLTARAFGVAVDRFSIGFGRTLLSFRDRWGVEWRIASLPLGGYVRFSGDENVASVPDQQDLSELKSEIARREGVGAEKRYFYFKPLWQRALIVAAGPAINFVFAIGLLALLVGWLGEPMGSTRLSQVTPASPAAAAGLRAGDDIKAIDGHALDSFEDLSTYVQDRPGAPLLVTLQRAGQTLTVPITAGIALEPSPAGGVVKIGRLGVGSMLTLRRYNPIEALGRGAVLTWKDVARTGAFLARIVSSHDSWPLQGFLGAAHVTGAVTQSAITDAQTEHASLALMLAATYINLTALLSISIGLVNLVPIPVLDGGHLLFYAYEAVARRPVPAGAQAAGYRVGLALLVGLMLFTAWHDLQRMQVFHYLNALFS
ncbi:MAG TPA: M50 family metallopeptidase [Caulobacteraceae bacterium]